MQQEKSQLIRFKSKVSVTNGSNECKQFEYGTGNYLNADRELHKSIFATLPCLFHQIQRHFGKTEHRPLWALTRDIFSDYV